MNNPNTNEIVYGAVWRDVSRTVDTSALLTVWWVVDRTVSGAVDRAVRGAMHGAVYGAVGGNLPHPDLQDFLQSAGE